jgi:transposase
MLYLGIDLHLKQLTVCVRNEHGDVTLRRQVSTRADKVAEFLEELRNEPDGYVAILEVCGFHDWLVQQLREQAACRDVVVIHPERRSRKKTDRRDAHRLSEVLWVSRERLLAGERVQGVRRVQLPTPEERHDRQLTSVRQRLGRQRTRTLNQIHYLLRRHNLAWQVPTKTFCTQKVRHWLKPRSRSFSVNVQRGRYQCFRCGSRGNALDLWAAVHKLPLHAAAIDLCQQARIDVPWIQRW